MGGLFGLDSPFVKFGNLIANMMILSLLWMFTSLITLTLGIGASTTAIYYVMTRRIKDKEHYIIKDYFKSFKREFVKSTIIWIIIMFIGLIEYVYIAFPETLEILKLNDTTGFIFISFQYFVIVELFFFTTFVFPLLSRFDLKFTELCKNTIMLSNKHFPTCLLCFVIFVVIAVFTYYFPPIILIGIGIYCLLTSFLFMRIFKKYRPEIDEDIYEL